MNAVQLPLRDLLLGHSGFASEIRCFGHLKSAFSFSKTMHFRKIIVSATETITSDSQESQRKIGGLQRLPMVQPSNEIIGTALKKARLVGPSKGIANMVKKERNRGAKQLDTLTKELTMPLGLYVKNFPPAHKLHPFEHSVLELTLGLGEYEKILERVDRLRKKLLSKGKSMTGDMSQAMTKAEAEQKLRDGYEVMEKLYNENARVVDDLKEMVKTLRFLPLIDPKIPTVCLVGAPNVGKSSIVRHLSSGKPLICNYPFTTRGIIMGHLIINFKKYQVTDTPGLLFRKNEDRNRMERLTLAALSHLSSVVVLFVHDLTEDSGTSLYHQFMLRCELKEKYPDLPWLDVVSKADMLGPSELNGLSEAEADVSYAAYAPPQALKVSVVTKEGLEELKVRISELLMKSENFDTMDKGEEATSSSI